MSTLNDKKKSEGKSHQFMTKMTTIDYMDKALKYGISKLPQEKIWQSSTDKVSYQIDFDFLTLEL